MGAAEKDRSAPPMLIFGAFMAIYLIWGSTYLAIRFAIETLPPFLMAGTRFLLAGSLVFLLTGRRAKRGLTRDNWLAAARLGLLMLVGGNSLVAWAEQYVPSGLAALMIGTMPVWMVLLDWTLFRGTRPSLRMFVSLLVAVAGVYILIMPSGLEGEGMNPLGAGALLLACAFWTIGSLLSRKAKLPESPFLAAGMEMLIAGLALFVLATLTGEWSRFEPEAVTARSLLALLYLAVVGSILTVGSYLWLLRVVSAAKVVTYAYVNPVVAIFLGAALGGEQISLRVLFAAAAIVAAVVSITTSGAGRRDAVAAQRPEPRRAASPAYVISCTGNHRE